MVLTLSGCDTMFWFIRDFLDDRNGINIAPGVHIEKILTMVNVRKLLNPNIELVINTNRRNTNQETSPDEFRQLANNIMEEFPEEVDESTSDDEGADNNGPTFTYPADYGDASKIIADEPWKPFLGLLLTNNTRVLRLLDLIGINPDVDSVVDFYYSDFDPSSDNHNDWTRIDAFNTLLKDDRFASICLHDELYSAQ